MVLKSFFTTFGLIFLAELGDKTQLATLSIASNSKSFLPVFLGATSALVFSSLLAVFLGQTINRYVPVHYMKVVSGILFIMVGVWILFDKA